MILMIWSYCGVKILHSEAPLDFSLQLLMGNSTWIHILSGIFEKPIVVDWTAVLRVLWNSLLLSYAAAAAAVRYQRQKEQFKMIMKHLLSYGDGKCGVWHAPARKSVDVTRGV